MKEAREPPGPIGLAKEIASHYLRYLKTTFHFKDADLRRSFAEALDRERSLVNGPFMESAPLYKRGLECRALLREILGAGVEPQFLNALNPTRRLYTHQEDAIRRAHSGRNIVVATGTGSGKTEAYLYPILLDLHEEYRKGRRRSGVHALVLYPMNALAEDQRQRLGALAKRLGESDSAFKFTFGRYTGETPEDEHDHRREASRHRARRLLGEFVFRSEMRASPPDILLTNYSMLEYLLLRPDDSPLFDGGHGATWRFIVLDEAHQYRGAKGLEMGMLVRRLKDRLRRGGLEERLRCIATSASLGGPEDREALARFAGELFDERFEARDIVLGETADAPAPRDRRLAPRTFVAIDRAIRARDASARTRIESAAAEIRVVADRDLDDRGLLHRILSYDPRVDSFRRMIADQPVEPRVLAGKVFDDELAPEDQLRAIESLASLAAWARDPESATEPDEQAPLLNVRFHLFLRALEGAFVSLHPEKVVRLSRGTSSSGEGHDEAVFEVALCRECGQHYLVGRRDDGKLKEAVRDTGQSDYSVAFFRPVDDEAQDGDEIEYSRLCVQCGRISPKSKNPVNPECGHGQMITVVEETIRDAHQDQARTCGACGYRGPDPVREVVHGTDGPSAVIATSLVANLPADRRKVLAFSDGRQEAAFFPCYLEETYRSVRDRSVLLSIARTLAAGGGDAKEFSLETLTSEVGKALRDRSIIDESKDDLDVRRHAWTLVFREFLTDERRLSLEGVGLAKWTAHLPSDLKVPRRLREPPWSLGDCESRDLVQWLLDSLRSDFAVDLVAGKKITVEWEHLELQPSQNRAGIGDPRKRFGFKSWDGKGTRRTIFLQRLLNRRAGPDEAAVDEAQALLREVWDAFTGAGGAEGLLSRAGDDGFRARSNWWRFRALDSSDKLFRCDICGAIRHHSIRGLCGRYRCPGLLREVAASDAALVSNHYRRLYEEERLPAALRAEEHTAQLDVEKAREFQRDFTEGKIHVLSSSTTFELGVDLGDLDAIFLRNVPPEPFNYAQRVGRAGRRAGNPGLAVTYCRRRPHDVVHFNEPQRMMAGRTAPPRLRWTNDKIALRHVAAVVLSAFFRTNEERFKSVEALCKSLESPEAVSDVRSFALENREPLTAALRAVVPAELADKIGIEDGTWIDNATGPESRLALAVAEASEDYRGVRAFQSEAAGSEEYGQAEWAKDRARTIASEDVISFLSRKAVVPKYGFPVDVVELDLHRGRRGASREALDVTLERDLAIAVGEFAPESEVVANKKVWKSCGLKRVAAKEWPRRLYSKCTAHGFRSWDTTDPLGTVCCDQADRGQYVDPIFGFVADRTKTPEDAKFRPQRQFTTRPYFVRPAREDEPIEVLGVVRMWRTSPGHLAVLCEGRKGRGFYVCEKCGAGSTKPLGKHRTPLGSSCGGKALHVALGHEFLTDVLRVQFVVRPDSAHPAHPGVWFAHSLAYALHHGATDVLEVPATDLDVTVRLGSGDVALPEIVLYDNVPGGAGLVAELENREVFRLALSEALKRVEGGCGCGPDTSCYGCLRSYTNQFAHPHLARGPAAAYFKTVLARWRA